MECIRVPVKLLEEMRDYIEGTEVFIENERGKCRGLKELIEKNEMPAIYQEVLVLLKSMRG